LDFSREIIATLPMSLRAIASPDCGWSDLGTPQRVAETLGRSAVAQAVSLWRRAAGEDPVCLAASFRRLQSDSQNTLSITPK
ncbi:MAG TPA: hypothetical protein VGD54_09555, partial [Steroidobacteraceae bacterium]